MIFSAVGIELWRKPMVVETTSTRLGEVFCAGEEFTPTANSNAPTSKVEVKIVEVKRLFISFIQFFTRTNQASKAQIQTFLARRNSFL
jgi:hypothetical protein